jgi:hypothetical protein
VYTFPLDESAAVTEFTAEIDGKTTVAVTKPRYGPLFPLTLAFSSSQHELNK